MKSFRHPSERLLHGFFLGLAAIHLGLGVWMFAAPHSFFLTIGAFDSYNPHYERDTATFYIAFALGSWVASTRPAWRLPILAITTLQYALHTINHGIDVNHANNAWAGPFDLISLGLATVQFAALLWIVVDRAPAGEHA
jgi:hypothetical protein